MTKSNIECEFCGEDITKDITKDGYAVISSNFDKMNEKDYMFFMSIHNFDDAKEFVTEIRMMGHFGVMMKFEIFRDDFSNNQLDFKSLLKMDEFGYEKN